MRMMSRTIYLVFGLKVTKVLFASIYFINFNKSKSKMKLMFIILSPSQLRPAPWAYETVWKAFRILCNLYTHLLHA